MSTSRRGLQAGIVAALATLLVTSTPNRILADSEDALIVHCARPCAAVVAAVNSLGGTVTHQYENIDAVAVKVPKTRVADLIALTGSEVVTKDLDVPGPRPSAVSRADEPLEAADSLSGPVGGAQPLNYNYNNGLTGAATLHAAGKVGSGVVVAVIDSGIVNVPTLVPALAGSVIGGETFVPAAIDSLSATHRQNVWHGTAVGDMIAAHATFVFTNTSVLVQSLNAHAPGSAIPCPGPPFVAPCSATRSIVPMTGTAPGASLYAMKVFQAQGGGAPGSRIMAAMDRAITLRRNFNAGMSTAPVSGTGSETSPFVYNALKIDVVNMSLGGPTFFAGRDLEDQLTLALVDAGITLVVSAGNDGFAAMTGGSPGTGLGSLTVGAATTSVHERVLVDNQFGLGVGALYRPTTHVQTAYFSSRGPTADGRIDPDISANGDASFVQAVAALTAAGELVDCRAPGAILATCVSRILFVSGTSFSGPTVAGAAALLRKEEPTKTATQVRNSLHFAANPAIFGDGSGPIDRGKGFLDVPAALALLQSGHVSNSLPDLGHGWHGSGDDDDDPADDLGKGGRSVSLNVKKAGFQLVKFSHDSYTKNVSNLKPGQVAQFFVPSDPFTTKITFTLTNVTPELPPAQQNVFFGDDIFYAAVDAVTSTSVLRAEGFAPGDLTRTIDNPQTGLVRIALQGDWTNAGMISATLTITRERKFDGFPSKVGLISQDDVLPFEFDVPAGVAQLLFETAWLQNWSRYPTNDLDMILIDPVGNQIFAGATINSPERVAINTPAAGRWTAVIVGFDIHTLNGQPDDPDRTHGRHDVFTLQVRADGVKLRPRR